MSIAQSKEAVELPLYRLLAPWAFYTKPQYSIFSIERRVGHR